MKGLHSNTKVVFAYQDLESRAATTNRSLDINATSSSVIRVVVPKTEAGTSLMTHHNYSSTGIGLESYSLDSVTGVAISKIIRVNNNSGASNLLSIKPTRSITSVQSAEIKGQLFDINLSNQLDDALANNSALFKAVIEIFFSSGDVETLVLNLRSPSTCTLIISPGDIKAGDAFNINTSDTLGANNLNESFVCSSYSKSYRSLNERKNVSLGSNGVKNIFSFNNGQDVTFSAPFGFAVDAVFPSMTIGLPGPPPPGPSWAPNGFATSKVSHLTWFSGKSDMTRMRIANTDMGINTAEVQTLSTSGISLYDFFGRVVTVDDYDTSGNTLSGFKYLQRVNPEEDNIGIIPWGQNYGWLSTFTDGNIRNSANDQVAVSQDAMNFGVPPIFKENFQTANSSGLEDTNTPLAFWGAFSDSPGDNDGNYIQSYTAIDESSPTTNPIETRYSRLFWGPNGKVPGTNVDTEPIVALSNINGQVGGNGEMNVYSFLLQYDLADTRNYFCFYPTYTLTDTGSDIRDGSIKNINVNPGANFFYAGTAGTNADAYMPVFKGIIRVMTVLRYADLDSGNTANMGAPIASAAIAQHGNDFSALDMYGMYFASRGAMNNDGSLGLNAFNGIDITANLLFTGHSYPNRIAGELDETQSPQLPNLSDSSGMMYLWKKGYDALCQTTEVSGNVNIKAQDIAVLNSCFTPDPYNTGYVSDSSDSQRRTISRNHPIGHGLSSKLGDNLTQPINSLDHILATSSDYVNNTKPFAFTSRAYHADYGEDINNPIPPYPYAPTSFAEYNSKPSYVNYANTNISTSNDGYFNITTSDGGNGNDISSTGGKIPTFPVGSKNTTYITRTGTNNCFNIMESQVTIIGAGNVDLDAGIDTDSVTIEYRMRYFSNCTSDFQTSGGSKVTTAETVAGRVTEVLQIFPHIEYRPLAMLSALNDNPFAYTNVIEDENDVDDISITNITDTVYELLIVITSDTGDVIDVGENEDVSVPFGDIFGDTEYPTNPSNTNNVLSGFSQRYISVEGQSEFGTHKASYITIASSPDWENFAQATDDVQAVSTDTTRLAYHTPFLTFNNPITEDDVVITVLGCTDPNADNYNPDANTDDGSCEDCNTISSADGLWDLQTNGINDGATGMRVGVYDPGGAPGAYLYGLVGGNTAQTTYFNPPVGSIYDSIGAKYGGAVVASNDFAGQTSVSNLSIKAQIVGSAFTPLINYILETYGEDQTIWRLSIKAVTDELLSAGLDFEESYSSANPVPAALANANPIYTSTATGGTITEPTWDNVSSSASPLAGLQTGFPYILELQLDPTKVDVTCTELNGANNIVLGLMWVAFCSCSDTNNEYFTTAMSGATWPWQQSGAENFPILGYNEASNCPDSGSSPIYGDSAYPQNTCFRQDDALSDCNQYWLYCIANTSQTCATTIDSLDDAYQNGNSYYFDFIDGSITTNIEGVYNSTVNGFVWDPDIEYIITVEGPNTFLTQSQNDAVPTSDNIFQNEFLGITEPGIYTVVFQFLAPYADGFNDTIPCEFIETIVFDPPSDICEPVIPGCTDPQSDNYDELANVDNGTCETSDPCTDVLESPELSVATTTTASGSTCQTDTITVGGINYDSTVVVPLNNGAINAVVTYNPGGIVGGVTNFAILVLQESSTVNGINTLLDNVGIMFNTGNVPVDSIEGVNIAGIGFWSPLISTVSGTLQYAYSLVNIPPGNYYIVVVANPSSAALENCGEAAFIPILDNLSVVNVPLTAPDEDCPENCIGSDCEEPVLGCTDPDAENYSPTATFDDGSCEFVETFCEQNPNDELCIDCTDLGSGPAPRFSSGSLDETICDPVTGSDGFCTDPNACNYNPDAPLDVSNNLICDYCSCVGEDDPDCYEDTECDPDTDPNCQGPDPECPDPNNPDCDPTIYDPCPTGDCGPPLDPCIILGNCPEDGDDTGDSGDDFEDIVIPVEVTCAVDVETADGQALNFSSVQQQAFLCMSQEGQKLLFRMKSGAYYDDTDVLKLSLIAYLFAGGLNKVDLPCLFNCNYDSADKARAYSCSQQWAAKGARYYNSTDTYSRGDIVMYYYLQGGKVTRNYYTATRDINPIDLQPRYFGSGWHRCQDITLRTADKNNIATGNEEYLQVFWEFMTRFCNECEVGTISEQLEDINNVDPTVLKNYLDPKTNKNNSSNNSGIIGEDGEEIIF